MLKSYCYFYLFILSILRNLLSSRKNRYHICSLLWGYGKFFLVSSMILPSNYFFIIIHLIFEQNNAYKNDRKTGNI